MVKTSVVEQGQTIAELRRELEARNRDLVALYDVTAAASQSLEIKRSWTRWERKPQIFSLSTR